MGSFIILWHWTDAWRCKCVTPNVTHPELYTDNPEWMKGRALLGVYDATKPLDMFKLATAISDECSTDCWRAVRAVLQMGGEETNVPA